MNKIIPNSWEEKKFGEIGKLQGGFAFKSSKFKKKGIPIIRISNLNNGKVDLENLVYSDHVDKLNNFLIKKNDILIAMSGATTGKIGIYQSNRSAYLNQRVGRFLIQKNELLNLGFLAKIVQQDFFLKKLLVDAIGGAQPNISSNQIEDLSIKIPPLAEQKKIASILNSVDDLIEKTQSQINKLQDLKKATMNELLTKGIGHADFKDSELGRLPKGWEIKKLQDIGFFKNGINKSKENFGFGTHLISISDVYNINLNYEKLNKVHVSNEEIEEYKLQVGDIIFVRSSVKPDGVGYPLMFKGFNHPVVFSGFMIRFRFNKNEYDPLYLKYFMEFDEFRIKLMKVATISANTNINQVALSKLKISLPKIFEQKNISKTLLHFDNYIQLRRKKLSKIKKLKKSLIQDLLTGKVRVSVN